MAVRVLVVDDQYLVRHALMALLSAAPGIDPVGEASDGERAVALVADLAPDVVLMDIKMPVMDGLSATRRILAMRPETQVVVLTTFDIPEYVYTALTDGAAGFIMKDTPPDRIIAAVRTVAMGEMLISPAITLRLIETYAQRHRVELQANTRLPELTPRETEILRLLETGSSNEEIADQLSISEATVKTHVKHTMRKLDLTTRAQAVVAAYESGLVVPGSAAHRS